MPFITKHRSFLFFRTETKATTPWAEAKHRTTIRIFSIRFKIFSWKKTNNRAFVKRIFRNRFVGSDLDASHRFECVRSLQATHISSLPSEVLIYIFRWVISADLDVRSLEQCARVCRGFYICARDPQLWKMICWKIWGGQTGNPHAHVNWRSMFINRPHILFNGNSKRGREGRRCVGHRSNFLGVYISRATYIRQGEQSLDSFYSPWHLVEYYRYLRFFPDGEFSP